jgi:DAACS family dicarboxylate/amino acid:cation (Na+ or H+) symporter|tara:strand:- start:36 stop:233 length:198 start_codon:yes stop_codon:yes gene_type:complete
VTIFIILETIGLTGETVSMIVGAMLAADRPLDMYRGIVNIFSDSVGAVVIAVSQGEDLDLQDTQP